MADNRRDNGTGNIYERENGTWVGRLKLGKDENGKPIVKYFSGKTKAEVKKKIKEFSNTTTAVQSEKILFGDYLMRWLTVYKSNSIKRSSYDRLENSAKHQVIPYIGAIRLSKLSSNDIQQMLLSLKSDGYSYSIVKKAHDLTNAVLKHAIIEGDLIKNPMLTVQMPKKDLFEIKEINIFTRDEVALITEEVSSVYSTGKKKYPYGDAFIVMINTGIRMGEMIGLKIQDVDFDNSTIHIMRNIQSVNKRDSDMKISGGKELVENTTKTYSGNRIIPINQNAKDAIKRLISDCGHSEYVMCTSTKDIVPPERLERSFYRVLDNCGISRVGTHTLRHTFASMLFSNGVDVKSVSKLLGHASIQITLNTYIHLIENQDHVAVKILDNII